MFAAASSAACALLLGAACNTKSQAAETAGMGPNPVLPSPKKSLVPTVKVAPARGWRAGETPVAASGTVANVFASGLEHPRWLYVLPNGDVLVAETNAPPKPADNKGVRGWFMKRSMKKAGAAAPSANRLTLLRDANADGVAESQITFLEELRSPLGMALVGEDLYVADTDALVRYRYTTGATRIATPGTKIADLPAGPRNHHWTKNVVASPDGSKLYVAVGSNSNIAEHGLDEESGRACIWEIKAGDGTKRVYASGLRNPVGMAFHPDTGHLWTSVNERDELGNDLVPDYLTSVKDGGFYGWPYSYFGQHVDARVKPARPDLVAQAIAPDYALGSHTSSLGLAFARGTTLPDRFKQGAFIGQHGSWNRDPPSGYKVIFVPFANGKPVDGPPVDVLTGFLDEKGQAKGRPVGVAVDKRGALLVADDVGNMIWRVSAATPQASKDGKAADSERGRVASDTGQLH